ncbi:S-adenosyl-L-methionine-dependent methyltransferase [Halenospora varia]|nr:S-adenosyl-L-methionine-dependent methyltransferase [Halenospora varia]
MSHSHSHDHSHSHSHSHHVDANRSHWNEHAATYNSRFEKTIQQIIDEIQARRDWIGVNWVDEASDSEAAASSSETPKRTVRLLDYACGTGLVSRALAPYVTQCVGVDLSEGMVAEYNKSVSNQGIPPSEMFATVGNLLDADDSSPASLSGPEFFNFDIACVGLGFHHFDNPTLAARRLAERLKPGGVLLIVDFLPHEHMGHDNPAVKTVTHNGFSEEEVQKMFVEAGAGEKFSYVEVGKGIVFTNVKEHGSTMKRSVFFARGSKL